jgi:hypothetical protein
MANNAAVPRTSVWVQLYYEGQEEAIGEAIKITPIPDDVHDLKLAVFSSMNPAQIAEVKVYASGTTVPFPDCIEANVSFSAVATGATYEEPLIVIAP